MIQPKWYYRALILHSQGQLIISNYPWYSDCTNTSPPPGIELGSSSTVFLSDLLSVVFETGPEGPELEG